MKRLIGRTLLDGEFVTSEDLEKTVEPQKQINSRVGEILIGMGVLNPVDLRAVLSIQQDLSSLDAAVKVGGGARLLLGELFVKAKMITSEQLDYALRGQRRTGEMLGELLVRRGLLMEHELETALAFQRHQREGLGKLRLGEILVTTGQITRQQLEEALKQQKVSTKKIGELLVDAGYVKPSQIEHCLTLQQKLVTAAIIAALSLPTSLMTKEADAATPSVSTKINITARVLERATMQVLNQVRELVITNADIKRGYVEVPAASRISIKTNNRSGCLLAFETVNDPSSLFSSVFVNINGREVQLSAGSGWIQQPYMQSGFTQDISYRFALSRNARPGTYTWPLSISVLPLGGH